MANHEVSQQLQGRQVKVSGTHVPLLGHGNEIKSPKLGYSSLMLVPKLLEIFHISVRILSENCQIKKCVRNQWSMCQTSIKKLSGANICQNSIREDLENHQKCVRFYKCVRKLSVLYLENCLKCVRNITFDTFLTHLSSFVDIFWGVGLTIWSPSAAIKSEQRFWT